MTLSRPVYGAAEDVALWTAVDDYAASHLLSESSDLSRSLKYAQDIARAEGLPDAEVSRMQGQLLQIQARMMGAKNILEIGTLGGYSAIWLATASPETRVTTIEVDEHHAGVARRALQHAELADRVEVLVGAGVDVLEGLKEEVAMEKRAKFDIVFIDADKPYNVAYMDRCLKICRSGACIVVDNVVRGGMIVDTLSIKQDPKVKGSRDAIEFTGQDDRFSVATMIQTVGEKSHDGFLMCLVA